ncbi:alpha/beta fold hydrolase [Corynebacterium sputi]|uniref:alpha/beta fold hydrolase n=1 Tax=Corynebacterium sputi TaxID=489915 RepID=UPI0003F57640|nr:alpha/beta hydrolase [Corynebacterium sputi]
MPSFSVPGATIDMEFSDEHGHPVVQLHGLTSSRKRDRILDLDLGRGLSGTRLLRYDARGHGRSTGRQVAEDYQWPNLADDLLRILDQWFPGEQVHGVGPSMGSATLLHAAIKDPGRFSSFTLMVPPTAWETRAAKADEYRFGADLVEKFGVEAMMTAGQDVAPPPARSGLPVTLPDVTPELLPWALRGAAMSNLPDPEQIASIGVRTSILAWTDDPGHPVSTALRLTELMPNASLRVARTPAEVDRWPSILMDDVDRISRQATAY